MGRQAKVHFRLTQDQDGYPPAAVESVWAEAGEDAQEYKIDNVPFFSREATLGDIVKVRSDIDGHLWFDALLRPSGNSLIRIVFFDRSALSRIQKDLQSIGCSTEYAESHNLLGVSIPPNIDLTTVRDYLANEVTAGTIDYEEPMLRHLASP